MRYYACGFAAWVNAYLAGRSFPIVLEAHGMIWASVMVIVASLTFWACLDLARNPSKP